MSDSKRDNLGLRAARFELFANDAAKEDLAEQAAAERFAASCQLGRFELEPEGEPAAEVELNEFLAVNADTFSDDDVRACMYLQPGEFVKFGGGAAPEFSLRRVS